MSLYYFVSYSECNTKRLIEVIYRPPFGNFPLFLEKLTHFADIINTNYEGFQIVIMVDFNFDLFKMKDDARVTEYYSTMVGAGLFPLIPRSTSVSHANVTLIGHIRSNFADKNIASEVQYYLIDYYALFANFPSNLVSKNGKKIFSDDSILRTGSRKKKQEEKNRGRNPIGNKPNRKKKKTRGNKPKKK